DNTIKYRPFINLPNGLNIFIVAAKNNEFINNYTNSRISRPTSSIYFFSNENVPDKKTFPFLVNNIPAVKNDYIYEQGELASDSSKKTIQYYYDDAGKPQSAPLSMVNPFVNENDRLVVPRRFDYTFINTTITEATFDLKDGSGSLVKSISLKQAQPIKKATLDFSDKVKHSNASDIFSLQVSGNNNFSETNNITFSDSLYSKSNWAIITIKPRVSNSDFNILTDDGFLKWEDDPGAGMAEFPAVFLVPVKSRYANYRFLNDIGLSLDLKPDSPIAPYLLKTGNDSPQLLITKVPVSLSKYYFLVGDKVDGDPKKINYKYFPNPLSYLLNQDATNRIYVDVRVPQSDLFPVVPINQTN
ncbi:MAG TPA: hypothetical protein VGI82_00850, partial [Chitinophagaceae bacterium]